MSLVFQLTVFLYSYVLSFEFVFRGCSFQILTGLTHAQNEDSRTVAEIFTRMLEYDVVVAIIGYF